MVTVKSCTHTMEDPEYNFYNEWHGHRPTDLRLLHEHFESTKPGQNYIYFAGDSTLDNKYWFSETAPAVNGYEKILSPPRSKCDVAHWLNKQIVDSKKSENFTCINTSIEATTLSDRYTDLWPQDKFIRDNIKENDVLVVSIGGNDVALRPSFMTICAALGVLGQSFFTPVETKKLGTGRFIKIFGSKTQDYIEKLVSKTKPKLIIVTMLYFLDENKNANSWAGATLGALRYNSKPEMLQHLIRQCYEHGTKTVKIEGSKVVYLPFFEVLDGKDTTDYVARVEPSAKGGMKMGKAIWDKVNEEY